MNPIRKLFDAYLWAMALLSVVFMAMFLVPAVGVHRTYRLVRRRLNAEYR
jgi:hypothetical protein